MALTNAQYNMIMREYEKQQAADRSDQRARLDEVYAAVPEIRALDSETGTQAAGCARELINGDESAMDRFRENAAKIRARREELLTLAGFPADYTKMRYRCPDCKDTGYRDGRRCRCFEEARVRLLYDQSSLKHVLERENFSNLDEDIYDETPIPEFGISQREYMKNIIRQCREFAENFPEGANSLLFTGPTGVGKTFLANCIAKELIDRSFGVIYFVAQDFFEILSRCRFGKDDEEDAREAYRGILDCDLLILDDLGTEINSSFVSSQLFYCINERIEQEKGTIISTNLTLKGLRERYSDRVTSRLMSSYQMMPLYGSDLRLRS